MADQPEAVAPVKEEKPYDLGNTEYQFTPPEPEKKQDRPRNPDGTYAKIEKPPEATPEPSPEPEKPQHPAYLVEMASSAGYTAEEIASIPTDQLQAQCWRIMRERERLRDEFTKQRIIQEGEVRKPPEEKPPEEPSEQGYDWNANPDGFDARIAKTILRLESENKKLKETLGHVHQSVKNREISDREKMIDGLFANLGPEYEGVFGKGGIRELPKDSPQIARRHAVVGATDFNKGPAEFARVAKTLFEAKPSVAAAPPDLYAGGNAAPTNGNQPRITEKDWEQAALAKPTQRRGEPEPKGDKLAVRNLTKKIQEITGEQIPDSEELDGLLP